jgi:hypothetical protein
MAKTYERIGTYMICAAMFQMMYVMLAFMGKLVLSNVIVRTEKCVILRQENVSQQNVILDGKVPPVTKVDFFIFGVAHTVQ